jgi:exopolysaccharide production protein ExoZ
VSKGGQLRSLQVLRFVAAGLVVSAHSVNFARDAGAGGWIFTGNHFADVGVVGVDIFFAISGAIIYFTAFERSPQTGAGEFARRRLTRVLPIYYIVSLLGIPVAFYVMNYAQPWQSLLTTVLFWPAWPGLWLPVLGVGWTLSFEMLFYACAALVLLWRPALWGLLALYGAALLLRWRLHSHALLFLGNPIVLEFLFGVAVMRLRHLRVPPVVAVSALVTAFAAVIVPGYPPLFYNLYGSWSGPYAMFRVMLFGVPAAVIVWAALQIEPYLRGRIARIAAYLGDASYSLYLTHSVLFMLLVPLAKLSGLPAPVLIPLGWLLAVGCSVAAYEGLEKPIAAALRPRFRPLKQEVPQSTAAKRATG